MKKQVKFAFSGKMARLLGRESVSSDIAAIFELVKNAYDADAENVTVSFEDFSKDDGKNAIITIDDDGDGMDENDIEAKWMIIGTDIKEKEPRTKRKRRRVIGNKGVGRFATERLCHNFEMFSRPRNSNDEIKLKINWDSYEQDKITFNDVSNTLEITEKKEKSEHGIKIILSDVRDTWTSEKIDRLRLALNSLVIPKELEKISDDVFRITVIAKEFETKTPPEVSSLLLKHAPYKITSTIGENQSIYKITIRREGNIVREERADLDGTIMDSGDEWEPFGKCKLTLYFFPGQSRYEDWNKYYKKALNINNIVNALTDIHGIKLYRDGFWVRPYGDLGNDWLSLERERVQANYKLGNSQVIGFVQIGKDQNESIIDTTTRERLVENASFHSMRTFVKDSIDIVSSYRKELNRKLKQKQTKKNYRNLIESEIKHFKELIDVSDSLTVDDKKKFSRALKDISDVYTDYEQETEEELSESETSQRVFRNLASLGISSATTSHEIGHVIGHLGQLPKQILNKLQKEPKAKALVEQDLKATLERVNVVRYFMTFINEFVRSIANDSEVKQKKERIKVKSITSEYVKELSGIMRMNDLTIQLKVIPPTLSVYMNAADFSSIILNLFSNSLKSLQKLKKGIPRKVRITISKDTRNFKIKFSDNGVGIKPVNREKVFRLFYTTNKRGTGLGLPIVKEILEDYGGTIQLADYSELDDGATFLAAVPLEGLKE